MKKKPVLRLVTWWWCPDHEAVVRVRAPDMTERIEAHRRFCLLPFFMRDLFQ